MPRNLEIAAPTAHRAAAAHHSRSAACLWLLAACLVGLAACGTVDVAPTAKDGAGGNGAADAGGAARGAGGAAGEMGAAGAGGKAGGPAAAAGSSGSAGQGGTGGARSSGPDPRKAPTCLYTSQGGNLHQDCRTPDGGYVEVTVEGGIPGSGVNSWRCRMGCALNAGTPEPMVPCSGTNAVYCVSDCSKCY